MDSSCNDLDDYVDKFRDLFFKQNTAKRNDGDLLLLIENLSEELQTCKENESVLQKNVDLILQNNDTSLTKKYVEVREKCEQLEKENADFRTQIEELNAQLKLELEVQKCEYLEKLGEMEKNNDLVVTNLKNKLESDRICFETKVKELYNELQLAQAATAIQCDEIESNLKRQLVDVSSKLRQSQNLVRNLQMEVNNLKSQLATHQKKDNTRSNVLYFNETPIKTVKNNIVNNITTYRPPVYSEDNNQGNFYDQHFPNQFHEGQIRPQSTATDCSTLTKIADNRQQYFLPAQFTDEEPMQSCTTPIKIPGHFSGIPSAFENKTHQNIPDCFNNAPQNSSDEFSSRGRPQGNYTVNYQNQFSENVQNRFPENPCMRNTESQSNYPSHQTQVVQKMGDSFASKYPPLQIHSNSDEPREGEIVFKQKPQITSTPMNNKRSVKYKNNPLPPLMPCTESNMKSAKKSTQKRRKLYNPDDYEK